jgi:hypothetical protein
MILVTRVSQCFPAEFSLQILTWKNNLRPRFYPLFFDVIADQFRRVNVAYLAFFSHLLQLYLLVVLIIEAGR